MFIISWRRRNFFLASIFISLTFSNITYAINTCRVLNEDGQEIQLKTSAKRIISLAPDITENLFAVGAGNNIVGVVKGSDYPEAAKKITIVGSYAGIDLEKIISLQPDLIVAWQQAFPQQLNALKKFGIPIYVVKPISLVDIPKILKNLGCLTGQQESANNIAEIFTQQMQSIKEHYQQKKIISVFYQIGSHTLMTINKKSWINEAIEACGGKNIFANLTAAAPVVNWEAIIVANPLIVFNDSSDQEWRKSWEKWPQITAVANQQLYSINADLIERASPRLLAGVKMLCQSLAHARDGA